MNKIGNIVSGKIAKLITLKVSLMNESRNPVVVLPVLARVASEGV